MATARGLRLSLECTATVAALGVVALIASRPIFAVDLFWLLALGRQIAQTATLPTTDLFSAIHPGAAWVQFQWLWELAAYLLVERAGLTGLRAAQAAALVLGYGGLYVLGRWRGHGVGLSALVCCAALLLFVDRFRLRPDAMNFVLLVPLLPTLAGGFRTLETAGRAIVATWCFVWAGMHGGGVLWPIAAALALCLGAAFGRRLGLRPAAPGELRAALWLLASCVIGALLCPTTLPGLHHFFSIYGAMSAGSPEWSPTLMVPLERLHMVTLMVAAAPALVGLVYGLELRHRLRHHGPQSLDLGLLLLAAGCLVLSAAILRMAFLAFVPLWLVIDRHRAPDNGWAVGTRRAALALAAIMFAGVTHYAVLSPRGSFATAWWAASTFDTEPGAFPQEAIEFVSEAGLEGTIMNGRAAGGPLIYYGFPQLRVLCDSRHNLSPDAWRLVRGIERGDLQSTAVDAGFARYGIELALLDAPIVRAQPLSARWQLLFRAGRAEVYQHLDGDNAQRNLTATHAYLRRAGMTINEGAGAAELRRAAAAVGGKRYLTHPFRKRQRARIEKLMADGPPEKRTRARRVLARMLLDTNDLPGAAAALAPEMPAHDGPRTWLYRAELAYKQGRIADVETPLTRAISEASALPRAERQAARALSLIVRQSMR